MGTLISRRILGILVLEGIIGFSEALQGAAAMMPFDVAQAGHGVAMQNVINPPLIRSSTALAIAEVLLRERWSSQAVQAQLPLQISDQNEHWKVLGARRTNYEPEGRYLILIRKADGLIGDIEMLHGEEWGQE